MKRILFCLLAIFSMTSIFADQRYKVFDLGTLNMDYADEAVFINDFGDVCIIRGTSTPKNITNGNFSGQDLSKSIKESQCYFWNQENGLKYVGNILPIFLNNLGQIVGYEKVYYWSPQFESINYKTSIFNSQTSERLFLLGDYSNCRLISCNDNGQVVFHQGNGLCLWDNNKIKKIDDCNIDFFGYPVTLNNKYELFGTGKSDYGYQVAKCHPFDLGITYDINPSMKKNFYSVDVNNLGQCIVYWKSATEEGAFLWPLGRVIPPNSRKINDKGQILTGDTTLIQSNGEVIEINKALDLSHDHSTPFEKIDYIHDINNNGQMVGRGIVNGKRHAVLISPACH